MWRSALLLAAAGTVACDSDGGERRSGGDALTVRWMGPGNIVATRALPAPGGGVFLAIVHSGDLDLGGGDNDAFDGCCNLTVAKLESDGEHVWSLRVDSAFRDDPRPSLALTAGGDLVVAVAAFDEVITFPGGTLEAALPPVDPDDPPSPIGALALLDGTDGTHIWSKALSRLQNTTYTATDVTVATSGRIVLTGNRYDRRDLTMAAGVVVVVDPVDGAYGIPRDGWPHTSFTGGRIAAAPGDRVVLTSAPDLLGVSSVKLRDLDTSEDDYVWEKPAPRPSDPGSMVEVAVGPEGDVILATQLSFYETAISGSVVTIDALAAANGEHRWSWVIGTGEAGDNVSRPHVTMDSANRPVITGSFYGSVLIGERVLRADETSLFVLKLDSNGYTVWSRYASMNGAGDTSSFSGGILARDVHVENDDTISLVATALSSRILWLRLSP